jgi:hypothetical protein
VQTQVTLKGVGKFPFLEPSQLDFQFGKLTVGKEASQVVTLHNMSQVPATFSVSPFHDDGRDPSFVLSCKKGVVLPEASLEVTVTFKPRVVGMITHSSFLITVEGGNEFKLSCCGEAKEHEVRLSNKSIHFGEVQLKSATNRLLTITNESDQTVAFQFFVDQANIFGFSKVQGTVKAKSFERVIIEFFPQKTTNYYERVFCVVRNHLVLTVDLIGTGYDVLTKPMPVLQHHIDLFREKMVMGTHSQKRQDKMGDSPLASPVPSLVANSI